MYQDTQIIITVVFWYVGYSRGSNRRVKLGGLARKQDGVRDEFPQTKRRKYPQYTSE